MLRAGLITKHYQIMTELNKQQELWQTTTPGMEYDRVLPAVFRVLNLCAGVGGNRKNWKDCQVTAVENDPKIAALYKKQKKLIQLLDDCNFSTMVDKSQWKERKRLYDELTSLEAAIKEGEIEAEGKKPKFTAANILEWIQNGHAVPPGKQKDLLNYMISFVNHFTVLSQQSPKEPIQETGKYDEAYLNECIAKAKTNLSKITDIDKALDEIRGIEQHVTDEDIQKWAAGRVNEIDPDEYDYGDLLIEGAKALRDGKIQKVNN
jgi:hypothetical protein